jgi:predicted nucleic acid-binding protein
VAAVTDVICDASVVLKWFHSEGEAEVEAARALLDLHRARRLKLSVLDLTAYEIGNVLIRSVGVAPDNVAEVLAALDAICDGVALTRTELAAAATLASAHQLTFYDAAYAAAARSRGGRLATLDSALLAAKLGEPPSRLVA